MELDPEAYRVFATVRTFWYLTGQWVKDSEQPITKGQSREKPRWERPLGRPSFLNISARAWDPQPSFGNSRVFLTTPLGFVETHLDQSYCLEQELFILLLRPQHV